jgi:hypothetical protein
MACEDRHQKRLQLTLWQYFLEYKMAGGNPSVPFILMAMLNEPLQR